MHKAYALTGTAVAAAVLVATILTTPALASIVGPGWAQVTDFSAVTNPSERLTTLSVTTDGDIPNRADDFVDEHVATGFAWADLDTSQIFVTAIHPTFRDSAQNPDAWHAHTATLTTGTDDSDFCVDTFDSTPTAGIAINGGSMTASVTSDKSPVTPSNIDAALGFVIDIDPDCPPSNFADLPLGVNEVTS